MADTPETGSGGGSLSKGGAVLLRRADPTRSSRDGREPGQASVLKESKSRLGRDFILPNLGELPVPDVESA